MIAMLTGMELGALLHLGKPKNVAKKLGISPSRASRLVKSLEKKGLVKDGNHSDGELETLVFLVKEYYGRLPLWKKITKNELLLLSAIKKGFHEPKELIYATEMPRASFYLALKNLTQKGMVKKRDIIEIPEVWIPLAKLAEGISIRVTAEMLKRRGAPLLTGFGWGIYLGEGTPAGLKAAKELVPEIVSEPHAYMGKKQKFQPEEIAAQVRILLPGKRGERIALEIMKRHGKNNPLYKMALKKYSLGEWNEGGETKY